MYFGAKHPTADGDGDEHEERPTQRRRTNSEKPKATAHATKSTSSGSLPKAKARLATTAKEGIIHQARAVMLGLGAAARPGADHVRSKSTSAVGGREGSFKVPALPLKEKEQNKSEVEDVFGDIGEVANSAKGKQKGLSFASLDGGYDGLGTDEPINGIEAANKAVSIAGFFVAFRGAHVCAARQAVYRSYIGNSRGGEEPSRV
jgi:hypothetical protein